MKKILLLAFLATGSFAARTQTKGTNTIGLGINLQSQKTEQNSQGNQFKSEQKSSSFSLGYGHFIKDNERLGIDFLYSEDNSESTSDYNSKTYGGNLNYQKYFPLFKKFFAFGGGRGGYSYTKSTSKGFTPPADINESSGNSYSLGGYGGASWFLSKRLAFEAQLLSVEIVYSKTKHESSSSVLDNSSETTSTSSNFQISEFSNQLNVTLAPAVLWQEN